ncbi:uncharacterized protein LOC114120371 isoform X3 [Aphis gossypii]|uniref:uncharacterized protein LOC114120371 isoform X3 n=1 Tax=Aphis gossypii TaxID=80765 RepID=UPI0021596D72|nr:uncharacterized protein LOC114120371 isoform X3 [Aphis gossypii]
MGKMQKDKNKEPTHDLYGGLGKTSILNILVPRDMVSVIIGRGGSTINEITEQTQSKINISKTNIVGSTEEIITIKGNPENCTNACRTILEILQQKASVADKSDMTLRILIHENLISLIIGEEGNTIRNIMSDTETKINVSGISDITIANINYKGVCTVEGSIENISKAEAQISAKLRQGYRDVLYKRSETTPAIENETEFVLHILVPSDKTHVIIGEKGAIIKKITRETKAWINISKTNSVGPTEKAITIKGNPENCTNACRTILEILQQKASVADKSDMTLRILIHENLISLIIGEEGNTIRNIMSDTETKINVSGISDITIANINYKGVCTVEGSIENISKAEAQISAKLRQGIGNDLQFIAISINIKLLCEIGYRDVLYKRSETTPAIENETEFVLHILVPSDKTHVIIGEKGAIIKKITRETKAWINISKTNSVGPTEKAITIKGNPENCTNACRTILEILQQKASVADKSDMILRILIHENLISLIIGEEGNTIRNIMSDTETKINVSGISDITIANINYKGVCTVEGSIENISKAEAQISAKLRQGYRDVLYKRSETTPAIENETEFVLHILVPSNKTHVIIGEKGAIIKKITRETKAWVHIDKNYSVSPTEKALTIKGNPENCTNACRKILEILQQNATNPCISDMILKILIHNNLIGVIIGKGGNTMRKIMSETETKIYVSSISNVIINNLHHKRICTVKGSIENISKAEALISAKLRQGIGNDLQFMAISINIQLLCEIGFRDVLYETSETIPAIENETEFELRMLVPSDKTHVIIGKNGAVIKKITQETKVRIHIDKNNSVGPTEKAITIKGKPENCTNACRKILEILQQKMTNSLLSDMIMKILIHNNLIDIIIGGEGDTIRKIMSETNTNIFIPSITDITMDSFNYERIFTIKGSIENICKAQAQISEKISQGFGKMSHYKLIRVKPEMTNKKYKLLIVGLSYVGKSSIIKRYCQEVYQNTYQPTLGMDIHPIFIRFKNETIHLENRDMAGTEKHCTLENSYRGVHGICIVYDITNLNSLIQLDDWIKHIETFADPNTVKILIGSKCDDTSNRMISIKEGQIVSKKYGILFFEVSSKTNANIDKLFYTMISKIHDLQNQPTNIKEELDSINVIHKPMLDSDIKPNTILEQCPIIKKELVKLPEVPNIQSQFHDQEPKEHNQLIKINSDVTDESYKLIIVGPSGVGKSSIIKRFFKGVYSEDDSSATIIGIDFQQSVVKFKNKFIKLQFWDTAGTEKYRSLTTSYYRGAHGVFIVYDVTDVKSFHSLRNWIDDVITFADPTIVKILVGNKCDDTLNREISIEHGLRESEKYGIHFFEASSKTNANIDKLFYTMISKIHDLQRQATNNMILELYKPQEQPTQNSQSTQNVIKLKSTTFENAKTMEKKDNDSCSC